jgi:RNA recognition motif-containing protein
MDVEPKKRRRTPQQEDEFQNSRLKRMSFKSTTNTNEVGIVSVSAAPAGKCTPVGGEFRELFIKFLPKDVTEAEVEGIFGGCGDLDGPPVLQRDFSSNKPLGFGWVTYVRHADAAVALQTLNGHSLRGRHLDVSVATVRRERPHMQLRGTQQAAGTHSPALLQEILSALVGPDPRGTYVDGTFGRGGHSAGILGVLSPKGTLHGFDMDHEAIAVGEVRRAERSFGSFFAHARMSLFHFQALQAKDPRFVIHSSRFSRMSKVLKSVRGSVAGILLDLGISSPQVTFP